MALSVYHWWRRRKSKSKRKKPNKRHIASEVGKENPDPMIVGKNRLTLVGCAIGENALIWAAFNRRSESAPMKDIIVETVNGCRYDRSTNPAVSLTHPCHLVGG
jgi:hypothetical protein